MTYLENISILCLEAERDDACKAERAAMEVYFESRDGVNRVASEQVWVAAQWRHHDAIVALQDAAQ